MTTKPTVYPDCAVNPDGTDNDVTDPTSGQNNVVAPSPGKQATGFLYNEKPPRQHFNWLARLTTQWIRYLNEKVGPWSADKVFSYEIPVIGNWGSASTHDYTPPSNPPNMNTIILNCDLTNGSATRTSFPILPPITAGAHAAVVIPYSGTFRLFMTPNWDELQHFGIKITYVNF